MEQDKRRLLSDSSDDGKKSPFLSSTAGTPHGGSDDELRAAIEDALTNMPLRASGGRSDSQSFEPASTPSLSQTRSDLFSHFSDGVGSLSPQPSLSSQGSVRFSSSQASLDERGPSDFAGNDLGAPPSMAPDSAGSQQTPSLSREGSLGSFHLWRHASRDRRPDDSGDEDLAPPLPKVARTGSSPPLPPASLDSQGSIRLSRSQASLDERGPHDFSGGEDVGSVAADDSESTLPPTPLSSQLDDFETARPAKKSPMKELPIGPPPGDGVKDERKKVQVARVDDKFMDDRFRSYRQVTDASGGTHLDKIVPLAKKDRDAKMDPASPFGKLLKELPKKKKKKKDAKEAPDRPIYNYTRELAAKARAGDPAALQKLRDLVYGVDPSTKGGHANKEKLDGEIRDDPIQLPGGLRKTGNDETAQTSGMAIAIARSAGLDPDVKPVSTSVNGAEVTLLDYSAGVRLPVNTLPLLGGPDHFHPNASSKTPGKGDYHSKGNPRLDHSRMAAIMRHSSPASSIGAAMAAQVQNMKHPEDIARGDLVGFDNKGRDLAKDTAAQQDMAYASGHNRAVLKTAVRSIRELFPSDSPLSQASQLSDPDQNFPVDRDRVKQALEHPETFANVLASIHDPKERPAGFKYDPSKRGKSNKHDKPKTDPADDSDEDTGSQGSDT